MASAGPYAYLLPHPRQITIPVSHHSVFTGQTGSQYNRSHKILKHVTAWSSITVRVHKIIMLQSWPTKLLKTVVYQCHSQPAENRSTVMWLPALMWLSETTNNNCLCTNYAQKRNLHTYRLKSPKVRNKRNARRTQATQSIRQQSSGSVGVKRRMLWRWI